DLQKQSESLRLLHVSEVEELRHKIQEMNTELEITNRELSDLQNLYSSDTEKYKKRINELLKQLDDARKYENTTKIDEQLNILSEFNELKSRYEQIIIEHEASISKLNEEHADVIAVKDNLIRCLQREKEDLSNQFADFKKEAQNTLDTVQQQLLNTREEIVSIVDENNNLNVANGEYLKKIDILKACLKDSTRADCSEIEQIRTDNEIEENSKVKTESKWNQDESTEIDRNIKVEKM
ncbi:32545_t:CDS:1, partial [Racocetra persica]